MDLDISLTTTCATMYSFCFLGPSPPRYTVNAGAIYQISSHLDQAAQEVTGSFIGAATDLPEDSIV